ncbi:MAG: hypothetical protein HN919_01440 [Verrucomicrobia bacterium]|nr:hypothetical protein [Verrucomicrobiota bacterium]MBT7064940.1 hypothetical protein [Verrucomicrobiota bacterium]
MMKTITLLVALLAAASCATAAHREPAAVLGLTNPVSVASLGGCPDGGSTKGTLVDANKKEYHFFIDRRLKTKTHGRWYVGAEINSGKAELLAESDGRIGAIHAVVVSWLHRVTTPEKRSRLAKLNRAPQFEKKLPIEAQLREHAKWFIARRFMRPRK